MSDPEDQDWSPTHGMTTEERIGYEMIRTLEGQLVTDDTFKQHQRVLEKNLASLRHQLRLTYAVITVLAVIVGGLSIWGWASAQHAADSADRVQFDARCNQLILMSIADRLVAPEGYVLGCDMRPAELIVGRSIERDRQTGVVLPK